MKITLYLMTQKGYEVLSALIMANYTPLIAEVIVGRDRSIEKDYAEEIIALCKKNGIQHIEREATFQPQSDYSIAISWRWLIPASNSKLIVLHDSLLPKYRGFAPLVNMLCNKENRIGVTALFASEEYDQGNIIAQSATPITYPIRIAEAIDLISKNYVELVTNIVSQLEKAIELSSIPQDETQASYSLWRDEEDYIIDWTKSSDEILTFINAVSSPYKGAAAYINGGQKVRILEAELATDVNIEIRDIGKVIFVQNGLPVIVCGSGLLKLLRVVDDQTQNELLPFKNFRIRLTGLHSNRS